MTERAEIERLLNQTGRTLEGLPTLEDYRKRDLKSTGEAMRSSGIYETFPFIMHQSDVIELLICALRDTLAKVPKWISVDERKPPEDTEVLVYATEKIIGFGDAIALCEYGETTSMFGNKTGRYDWSTPWPYFHVDYKITHWMPLPEPPEVNTHDA